MLLENISDVELLQKLGFNSATLTTVITLSGDYNGENPPVNLGAVTLQSKNGSDLALDPHYSDIYQEQNKADSTKTDYTFVSKLEVNQEPDGYNFRFDFQDFKDFKCFSYVGLEDLVENEKIKYSQFLTLEYPNHTMNIHNILPDNLIA